MSNNKQSMKLYTEEQVKHMLIGLIGATRTVDDFLHRYYTPTYYTHIELSSDEEMSVLALKTISELNPKLRENEEAFYIAGFVECAKWMRDKIQGGNK